MNFRRSLWLITLLGATALALAATSVAWALGELTQKPGSAGCIFEVGTTSGAQEPPGCADGRALVEPRAVAVSPDGESAYVASLESNAVAIFDRDPVTGALKQKDGMAGCISEDGTGRFGGVPGECAAGKAFGHPTDIAISPDGKNVYVASLLSNAVAIFNRQPDGELRQKSGPAGCVSEDGTGGTGGAAGECEDGKALKGPEQLTISPDGKSVYVASRESNAVSIFDRDPVTGALRQKEGIAGCVSDDGTGGPGGAKGECQDGTALSKPFALAVSPDGASVYVASLESKAVAIFDRDVAGNLVQKVGAAGCVSDIGGACQLVGPLNGPTELAVSPDGKSVYVLSLLSEAVTILDRDQAGALSQKTGAARCIAEEGGGGCQQGFALRRPVGLTVSPDGENVYVVSGNVGAVAILDRTPKTGALAQDPGKAGCLTEAAQLCGKARAINDATGVAISPDGKNVYVLSHGFAAISIFDRSTARPPGDTTAPRISGFRLAPRRFKSTSRRGSSFRFALSERADVSIEIDRARRRGRGRRFAPRAMLSFAGRPSGSNAIHFSGRISRHPLAAGAYRATIVATDPAGNRSAPQRASFIVLPRGR